MEYLSMDRVLIQKIVDEIAHHTGLCDRSLDRDKVWAKVVSRMTALNLSTPHDYYQLLTAATSECSLIETWQSEREWQELIQLLTVTESYFFRDRGQCHLLKQVLLPNIIAKQRQIAHQSHRKPKLKIWSAGCSSGEEPYSIAILLKEILSDFSQWDISIIGTDINQNMLDVARRGRYSSWSFRRLDSQLQKRYFHLHGDRNWELDASIRHLVKFSYLNLVSDRFPNEFVGLNEIDLILCRNVFIYIESQIIPSIVHKFCQTLQAGGYLLVGHAELQGQALGTLQTRIFPQSVVYEKPEQSDRLAIDRLAIDRIVKPSLQKRSPHPGKRRLDSEITINPNLKASDLDSPQQTRQKPIETTHSPTRTTSSLLHEATLLFKAKAYSETIMKAESLLQVQPQDPEACALIARAYANLGEYQKATDYCKKALKVDPSALPLLYLLAQIAEVQGQPEKAKHWLKRIIYLEPHSPYAYLELAALYCQEGEPYRAKKMQETARTLLEQLPPHTPVGPNDRFTAGELLQQIHSS
jgi:chemotaxis protein methyltransferase CheR